MKAFGWISAFLLLTSCATFGRQDREAEERLQIWGEAHNALVAGQFSRADSLFARLASQYGTTVTGRESLFYLGALRLDPRNPDWNSARSEEALVQYLAYDTVAGGVIHRRPEGETLFQLAHQLNLPIGDRVPGLAETVEVRVESPPRVVQGSLATTLTAERNRLRTQVAEKDAEIRRLQEELDRIRRTLAAPGVR